MVVLTLECTGDDSSTATATFTLPSDITFSTCTLHSVDVLTPLIHGVNSYSMPGLANCDTGHKGPYARCQHILASIAEIVHADALRQRPRSWYKMIACQVDSELVHDIDALLLTILLLYLPSTLEATRGVLPSGSRLE